MKDIYCSNLFNSLSFHQKNVRFCTTLQIGKLISTYTETPKELAYKIMLFRKEIYNDISSGKIPDGCNNCIFIQSPLLPHIFSTDI